MHPYFNQQELREYNNTQNILTQAWSPLGRASAILKDPVLVELAKNTTRILVTRVEMGNISWRIAYT